MSWGRPMPRGWSMLRARVLVRDDYRCRRCGAFANQVDHVIPRSRGGPDTMANLESLCETHHRAKSNDEAAQARGVGALRFRPVEKHPGLIDVEDD